MAEAESLSNQFSLADLRHFDEIIDVRTPAEFAHDHVPGASNFPVLSDAERHDIGTLYKESSSFEAKKAGAALVARHIAEHFEASLHSRPRHWRPLVYCWRGGMRSGSFTHVLRQVGWKAEQLPGGYKAYRRLLIHALDTLPAQLRFRVLCGRTGSGKSRLLRTLAAAGEQVLDLESLAAHRGSVLGPLPEAPQPSQKRFESEVWAALARFDSARVIWVESESKKIGGLRVPEALIQRMWTSERIVVAANLATRVQLLLDEYHHFTQDFATLERQLDCLTSLHGRERIAAWKQLAAQGRYAEFVEALLLDHYDPAYGRSLARNYGDLSDAPAVTLAAANDASFSAAARALLAQRA